MGKACENVCSDDGGGSLGMSCHSNNGYDCCLGTKKCNLLISSWVIYFEQSVLKTDTSTTFTWQNIKKDCFETLCDYTTELEVDTDS